MHFDNLLQKKRLYSAAMLVKREASLKNVHFEQKRIKKALTQKLLSFEMVHFVNVQLKDIFNHSMETSIHLTFYMSDQMHM